MKVVVIGEAPNRAAEMLVRTRADWYGWSENDRLRFVRKLAGTGTCGERLAELAGVGFHDWLAVTDRHNVLDRWPGAGKKGDLFSRAEAALGVIRLLPVVSGRVVLFLGHRSAGAFSISDEYLRWSERMVGKFRFYSATFPHPSRINRWWNDPKNRKRAERFLRTTLNTARGEE